MKTAKEVLTKYSDGDYTQFQGYENILMAMDEYAKQYHESRMKEEYLHHFCTICKQDILITTRKNK